MLKFKHKTVKLFPAESQVNALIDVTIGNMIDTAYFYVNHRVLICIFEMHLRFYRERLQKSFRTQVLIIL